MDKSLELKRALSLIRYSITGSGFDRAVQILRMDRRITYFPIGIVIPVAIPFQADKTLKKPTVFNNY